MVENKNSPIISSTERVDKIKAGAACFHTVFASFFVGLIITNQASWMSGVGLTANIIWCGYWIWRIGK